MSEKDVVDTDVAAPLPGFGPVASRERIETLDILRGFALFCIFVVNWSVNLLAPRCFRNRFVKPERR